MDADVHPNSKLNTDGIALGAPDSSIFPKLLSIDLAPSP